MKLLNEFVMNYETILLYPQHDQFGNLFTGVMDNKGLYRVDRVPSDLIDDSLKNYGSSLRGARDGAGMILGNISMHPIVMNERLNIYWFPSKSPTRKDCVWFALHHIKDYKGIAPKKTLVIFSNGSSMAIDMSEASFDKKVQRAYKLKGKVEGKVSETLSQVAEPEEKYHIDKKPDEINYDIKKE